MTAARDITLQSTYGSLICDKYRDKLDWQNVNVSDAAPPSELLAQTTDKASYHILQTKNPSFASDLNTSALMASDTEALNSHPVSSILAPERYGHIADKELSIFDFTFTKASQKVEILEGVESALGGLSISASVTADLIIIADELVTNAVFNAPFVDLDNNRSGAPRESSHIVMTGGKSARLMLGADENRIVIGCRDQYGTLNMNKLFRRIKNCYDTSVGANINLTGSGGAGIGSYMIFNSAASYFAEVKTLSHTLICCTVPLRMSSRARFNIAKNLYYSIKK